VRPEVIAKRQTADHVTVKLWSNGAVTTGMNVIIGQSARGERQLASCLAAGWLVVGDVELYESSEVRDLLVAARWAAERGLGPGGMRDRLYARPNLKPAWTLLQADRDGKPVLQCWVLPRVRWPGLAVFRERGVYQLCQEVGHRTGTYEPTGFEFSNLRQLTEHLTSDMVEV
jgi:hypothetical protein